MWHPLFRRDKATWIGSTAAPGMWVGTELAATAEVDLDRPVFLWPLLTRSMVDVVGSLTSVWSMFRIPEVSPEELIQSIVASAVKGGSPYWVGHALRWLEDTTAQSVGDDVSTAELLLIIEGAALPQQIRHRARRLRGPFRAGQGGRGQRSE